MTNQDRCGHAANELIAALRERQPQRISEPSRRHLADCPMCRGRLLALVSSLDPGLLGAAAPISCDECLAELPAFLDAEQSGPAQAARAHQRVWWHLWTCAACAETYALSRALIEDPGVPALQLPPAPAPVGSLLGRQLKRVRVGRPALALAFAPPPPGFAVSRGTEDANTVVYDSFEEEPSPRQITVAIQEQADGLCSITVVVIPPVVGWLCLTCGLLELQTRFDTEGAAVFQNIAQATMSQADGPDLEISIHADAVPA